MMANDAHGQSAYEFGLEPELDEIARLNMLEDLLIADLGLSGCGETDARFAHAFADDLFQSTESAADYEQNMLRIDHGWMLFATLSQIHHGLKLACDVVWRAGRNFGFLHQFEQVRLHAAATDIAPSHVLRGGDLVNFVDIN